jgi:mevalonate kinase
MPAVTATAPAKIILFGEHAVVYGRPAIAAPVHQLRARAIISPAPFHKAGEVQIQAPDVGLQAFLADLDENHPLAMAVRLTAAVVGVPHLPACSIRITSTIPIASGLGSGAAVSVAVIRAFSAFLGHPLPDSETSRLAFEIDKLYHGTPSGIDNTTITFGLPVFFQRDQAIELLRLPCPFTILIADTGIPSPTAVAVNDLRKAWIADPLPYERIFDSIAAIVLTARDLLEKGKPEELGPLMNDNHRHLSALGVSSPELERLVDASLTAGALGAKLSGGGQGGNMIVLVDQGLIPKVSDALMRAGASRTITTTIAQQNQE